MLVDLRYVRLQLQLLFQWFAHLLLLHCWVSPVSCSPLNCVTCFDRENCNSTSPFFPFGLVATAVSADALALFISSDLLRVSAFLRAVRTLVRDLTPMWMSMCLSW